MTIRDLIPWKRTETQPVRNDESLYLRQMNNEIEKMFKTFFQSPWSLQPFEPMDDFLKGFNPDLEINETDKEFAISVELPGVDEKDIQLTLGNGILTISGEKKSETQEKSGRFYRTERSYGAFERQVALPQSVDEDHVNARFKNGVLTVSLAKREAGNKTNQKIEIRRG